jgi:hypothetical protein
VGDQCGGGGQDGFEAFDRAQGNHVESGRTEGLCACVLYIYVRQCKGAGDFAEERGFLVVGLDQGQRDRRAPEFDGETGESGAGADVGYADSLRG